MVFPLFLIAFVWDQFNWGESRLLTGRSFQIRVFGRERKISTTALVSGAILIAMGVVVIVVAFEGNAMATSGWQVTLSARLQHYAHLVTVWAGSLPGWVTGIAIVLALAGLAWRGLRQASATLDEPNESLYQSAHLRRDPTVRPQEELQ